MGIPSGLITLNSNILCVVDTETLGLIAGYHDLVQVAILPLDSDLEPMKGVNPFYRTIKPDFPERAHPQALAKNGLVLSELALCSDRNDVQDELDEWFKSLDLPLGKRMIYLCQNAPFDVAFLKSWLGPDAFDQYFARRGRDTMFFANGLNDRAAIQGKPIPFPNVSLEGLAHKFGISYEGAHDALADCIITGKVYRELLRYEI